MPTAKVESKVEVVENLVLVDLLDLAEDARSACSFMKGVIFPVFSGQYVYFWTLLKEPRSEHGEPTSESVDSVLKILQREVFSSYNVRLMQSGWSSSHNLLSLDGMKAMAMFCG